MAMQRVWGKATFLKSEKAYFGMPQMATILEVQCSARKARSISRQLAAHFLESWRASRPDTRVITRDLADHPPPFVTEAWIAAAFSDAPDQLTDEQKAVLSTSDELIAEVVAADLILIATPMYNYGMPAALKAWFDQVIRVNKTFTFDLARGEQPIEPTLSGKTLVILSSRGEGYFGPGETNAANNHLEPHIATCQHFLGVEEAPHLVNVEFYEFKDERHRASKEGAFEKAKSLATNLSSRWA